MIDSDSCPIFAEQILGHQQTAHCENLAKLTKRKTHLRNLAKLVFAKPCESCETKVKLQNLYLRNLPKLVFAKLAKHDLRNNAKQCETLIAKIAKIEKHCERSKITKHSKVNIINTFTTGRLLRVARLC